MTQQEWNALAMAEASDVQIDNEIAFNDAYVAPAMEDKRAKLAARLTEKNQKKLDPSQYDIVDDTVESSLAGDHKPAFRLDADGRYIQMGNKVNSVGVIENDDDLLAYITYVAAEKQKDNEYKGKTRGLYQFGAHDGKSTKFGLSLGFNDEGERIDAKARYIPGYASKRYGFKAGPEGVDVDKNYMDLKLDYRDATIAEGAMHDYLTRAGKRTNMRKPGETGFSPEVNAAYGSGKSEYYLEDQMFNGLTDRDSDWLMEKGKEIYDTLGARKYNTLDYNEPDNDYVKGFSVTNMTKGAVAGFSGSLYGIADTVTELTGSLFGQDWDLGTEAERRKAVNGVIGYDSTRSDQSMKIIGERVQKMVNSGSMDAGDVWAILKTAARDGDSFAYSIGTLASWAIGGVFGASAKGAKAVQGIKAARAVGDTAKVARLTAVARAERAAFESMSVAGKLMDKSLGVIGKNAGFNAAVASATNDDMEAFTKNNGGEKPEVVDVLRMGAVNFAFMGLDRFTDMSLLKASGGVLGDTYKAIAGLMTQAERGAVSSTLRKMAVATTAEGVALVKSMGVEGAQEYVQTMGEIFNEQYNTEKYGDSIADIMSSEKNVVDALVGAGAGMGGGIQFRGLAKVKQGFGKGVGTLKANATKRAEQDVDTANGPEELNTDKVVVTSDDVFTTADTDYDELNTVLEAFDSGDMKNEDQEAMAKMYATVKGRYEASVDILANERARLVETGGDVAGFDAKLSGMRNKDLVEEVVLARSADEVVAQMAQGVDFGDGYDYSDDADTTAGPVPDKETETEVAVEFVGSEGVDYSTDEGVIAAHVTDGRLPDNVLKGYADKIIAGEDVSQEVGAVLFDNVKLAGFGSNADYMNAAVNSAKESLDMDESTQTPGYTIGLSNRTIEKLAKKNGVSPVKLQKSLMAAVGRIHIKKMASLGKKAGSVQYDIYHGKRGLIPMYAEYRSKLASGDAEGATKAIKVIQKRGTSQETKMNQFVTKYDELAGRIKGVVEYVNGLDALSTEEKEATIQKAIKGLDKVSFTISGQGHTMKALEVLGDIRGESKSTTMELMEAIEESITHVDGILSATGQIRPTDSGRVIGAADDLARYEATALEAEAQRDNVVVPPEGSSPEVIQAAKDVARSYGEQGENNRAGIDRIKKAQENGDSLTRWASSFSDVEAEIAEVAQMEPLEAKGELSKAEIKKLAVLRKTIQSHASDAKTLAHVESTLGLEVGSTLGNETPVDSAPVTSETRARIRANAASTQVEAETTPITTLQAEEVVKDFKPTVSTEAAGNSVKELATAREDRAKAVVKLTKSIAKAQKARAEGVAVLVDVAGSEAAAELYIRSHEVIDENTLAIKEMQEKLAALEKEGEKLGSSLITSLENRRKKLEKEGKDSDGFVDRILFGLEDMANELEGGTKGTEVEIKSLFDRLKQSAKNILAGSEGLQKLLYKYLQSERIGELKAKEGKLRKAINYKKKSIKEAQVEIDAVNNANKFKAPALYKKIQKLRAKRASVVESRMDVRNRLSVKIDELVAGLTGTALMENQLQTGAGKGREGRKSTRSDEVQELDLANVIDVTPSLFGIVEARSIGDLLEDDMKKEYLDELGKADTILNKVLAPKVGKDGGYDDYALYDNPSLGLLLGSTVGKLNPQVVAAIMAVAKNWAGANGAGNLFNTKEDVARMLGYADESQVSAEEYTLLKKQGMFRKLVSNSLGQELNDVLGIKFKDDVSRDMEDKVTSGSGMIVLAYMQEAGLIGDLATTGITGEAWNAAMESKPLEVDSKGTLPRVPMIHSIKGKTAVYTKAGLLATAIDEALSATLVGNNYLLKTPYHKNKDYNKVKGSPWSAPEKSQEILKVAEQEEYSLLDGVAELFSEVYIDDELYMMSVGWMDIDEMEKSDGGEKFTLDEVDAQKGKNREIEKSVRELRSLEAKIADGSVSNGLWFKWFFSKNGRYMLDSSGINPQTDKLLHRWMVVPKVAQNNEWAVGSAEWKYFLQGVAQGFGVDIDKEDDATIKAEAEKFMAMSKKELIKWLRANEVDHPGQALQAILAIEQARGKKDGDVFKATMQSEYDSVTSGFINKLLQMPIIHNVMTWFGKGGVFHAEDSEYAIGDRGMAQVIKDKVTSDVYRTLVYDVNGLLDENGKVRTDIDFTTFKNEELVTPMYMKDDELVADEKGAELMKAMLEGWDEAVKPMVDADGNVTGWARNMFKYPFMIFNYAASISSIRKNLASDLTNDVIHGIMNDKYTWDSKFMRLLGVSSKAMYMKMQVNLSEQATEDVVVGKKRLHRLISQQFNNTYGRLVENSMNKNFSKLTEANKSMTDATKVMFAGYVLRYEQEVERLAGRLGRSLTSAEVNVVTKSLAKEFPLIKAPNSESRDEGISVVDTELIDYSAGSLDKGSLRIVGKGGKIAAQKLAAMVREFKAAQAAGAVLPIHWIDGTLIGRVLIEGGALGVHDAIVIGNDFSSRIHAMNKATYDVGTEYELVNEILEALVESVSTTMKDGAITAETIMDRTDMQEGSLKDVIESLSELATDVDKSRDTLYGEDREKGLVVMNIADSKGSEFVSSSNSKADEWYNAVITKEAQSFISASEFKKILDEGCE